MILKILTEGGSGGVFAYTMKNMNMAIFAGGLSLAYLYAGSDFPQFMKLTFRAKLQQGDIRAGYDVGTAASAALLLTAGPRAYKSMDPYMTSMATLGGVSTVGNLLKSYQIRKNKPKDFK